MKRKYFTHTFISFKTGEKFTRTCLFHSGFLFSLFSHELHLLQAFVKYVIIHKFLLLSPYALTPQNGQHIQTIHWQPTNYLSVFDHFAGLTIKWLAPINFLRLTHDTWFYGNCTGDISLMLGVVETALYGNSKLQSRD